MPAKRMQGYMFGIPIVGEDGDRPVQREVLLDTVRV